MTNKPYTPDTDEVLQGFIASTFSAGISASEAHERADRWLATIEAAAEQRGAVAELEALGDKLTDGKDPETDTRLFDPWDVAQMLYTRADVIKNPPRADQYRKECDE